MHFPIIFYCSICNIDYGFIHSYFLLIILINNYITSSYLGLSPFDKELLEKNFFASILSFSQMFFRFMYAILLLCINPLIFLFPLTLIDFFL